MEYWIDENGSAIYCDGDAGVDVPNHEMIVKSRCISLAVHQLTESNDTLVARLLGCIEHLTEDDCIDTVAIREAILCEADVIAQEIDDEDLYDDPFEWMRKRCGISNRWEWQCAWGDHIDERSHAKKYWGWIRVAHTHIEMADTKRSTIRRLKDGLYEAFGEECESLSFHVEAGSHYFSCVPYMALDAMKVRRSSNVLTTN